MAIKSSAIYSAPYPSLKPKNAPRNTEPEGRFTSDGKGNGEN
jgi:hypothetical protein